MAKLTFEIELKAIKKFAALSDIDLTSEQEAELNDCEVTISQKETVELIGDDTAILLFAGIITHKKAERRKKRKHYTGLYFTN